MDCVMPGDVIFFHRHKPCQDFECAVAAVADVPTVFHCGLMTKRGVSHAWPSNGVLVHSITQCLHLVAPDWIEAYRVDGAEPAERAAAWAESKEGLPYNDVFSSDERDGLYCSQLVASAWCEVDWPPHALSFSKGGKQLQYWTAYFERRGRVVPEGEPGSHPAQLLRCDRLRMRLSRSCLTNRFSIPSSILQTLHYVKGANTRLEGGKTIQVVEPASGKCLTTVHAATREQVDSVVRGASEAQADWANTTWRHRADVMNRAADILDRHGEELAVWECRDNGKPLYEARMDVASCVDTFRFYAGVGHSLAGSHFPLDDERFAYTRREPMGVVGCVGAWNYPIQTCSWKTAPAIACGNAVVYKPSPLAPVSAVLLGEVLRAAGLPDGVYNVIQGEAETGMCLVEHPLVRKVSFTGSINTGKAIMQACAARRLKPATMELGGKSSLIVCADAHVDSAVAGAMAANFYSQGQVCSNASKLLVHRSVVDEFREKLVSKTRGMRVGDPMEEETRVGASISQQHLDRVKAYIDGAVSEGARLLCGGERVCVKGLEGGYYLEPAVLDGIKDDMHVFREEIFGAVALIIPYETEEEAIRMANDTDMGLAAGVFSRDLATAHRLSARLHAGNVYVNTYNDVSPLVPFGGYDQSGFGRENGVAVLEHYTQVKSVFVNTAKLDNPF